MSRQTYSYLRKLFDSHGISPRKQYGQNFLIDLNLHDVIVQAAEISRSDVVLEVGSGTGALTRKMADLGATVVAVEIDKAMAGLTREATEGCIGVRVIQRDALAGKHRMAPEVLDAVRSGLAATPDKEMGFAQERVRNFKLVANLPYCVATPIITNLLVSSDVLFVPKMMVVTIQWELAQRMIAAPQTEDYNALSVLIQALGQAEIVRMLPPTVFWPQPNVDSAIIKIVPDPERRNAVGDILWFQEIVRKIFNHRRKNIRRVLHGYFRDRINKDQIDAVLASCDLNGDLRAEVMNWEELAALAKALQPILDTTVKSKPAISHISDDAADEEMEDAEDPEDAENPEDAEDPEDSEDENEEPE